MTILEFTTKRAAEQAESAIFTALKNRQADRGYIINASGFIVSKIKGKNAPTAQPTEDWSEVYQSPDNTYYIWSPEGDLRTSLQGKLPFNGTEKDFPAEWVPNPEF